MARKTGEQWNEFYNLPIRPDADWINDSSWTEEEISEGEFQRRALKYLIKIIKFILTRI